MSNDLRRLAQLAKKRLNGASKENETAKTNTYTLYNNLYKHNYQIRVVSDNDDKLYSKVCSLLSENFDNPYVLAELVDKEVFATLNEDEKMRYMLNIVDKYSKLKEKYVKEHRNIG